MSEEVNIDQILAETETSTNQDIPMSDTQGEVPGQVAQETAREIPQTPEPTYYEFDADGKKVKVTQDDPRVMQWLKMGYSAPQRFGKLNQELEQYRGQVKDWEEKHKSLEGYRQIDEWAKQNPDKWAQVESIYRGQSQTPEGQQAIAQLPPEIQAKLEKHDQILTQFEQQQVEQRNQRADQGYERELESIRSQYSNLDFFTPDQSGNSLEAKILDHAIKNHIPSFTASFRDYFHNDLVKMAEEKGRESAGKTLAKAKNLGLQGKSPAPGNRMATPNLRNLNYDQITDEIMRLENIS